MQTVDNFEDVKLLDMANGEKLERWGKYLLIRPDPQIIWSNKSQPKLWEKADARYIRSKTGGGHWELKNKLPDSWQVSFEDLVFNIKPMGFKHTGLFPEQAVNWKYMMDKIKKRKKEGKETKVLNLFAYTGGATVACLAAGASVCHVDSSKGMVLWAKENVISSGLKDKPVRYIVDDVIKFVTREIKRGNKYDAIVMDPPSYGRGANGEVWSIEKDLENLLKLCVKLLSEKPAFIVINTYTGGLSGTVIQNLLKMKLEDERKDLVKYGNFVTDEIGLKMENSNLVLPCGITTKWEE
ncbi:MAG: class I SAM-dependent methyltransferase [Clostridia bacterium]|nr:class I SAM-dependent methyltransferase [Clostridia bacterium]